MSHAIPPCAEPPTWGQLAGLSYPHLGKYQLGTALDLARGQGGPPFLYSVDQIEGRLAFADVIVGLNLHAQTMYPDSLRCLRGLNPNVVILPYRIAEEQQNLPVPRGSGVDLDYNFWQGFPDGRYMRNSSGNYIYETFYPFIHLVNISSFAPVVNGQTYFSYMLTWLDDLVFPSGLWDGLSFDNLVASINPQIPNYNNPALLDFDFTLSGVHQSPAAVSDMTRSAATGMLQQFRALNGDLQLVLGNTGAFPPLQLAPYVRCVQGDAGDDAASAHRRARRLWPAVYV